MEDGRAALLQSNSRGHSVRLLLDGLDLARLGLLVADAQAALVRAVPDTNAIGTDDAGFHPKRGEHATPLCCVCFGGSLWARPMGER